MINNLKEQIKILEKKLDSEWRDGNTPELNKEPRPRGNHGRKMNTKRIEETEENRRWFAGELMCMKKIFSRGYQELSPEEYDVYYRRFAKCRQDYICEALVNISMGTRFPLPAELYDEYQKVFKKHYDDDVSHRLAPPSPNKDKSDEAVVMSVMLMHYKLNFGVEDNQTIRRYYDRHIGGDFDVDKLKSKLTREKVEKWVMTNDGTAASDVGGSNTDVPITSKQNDNRQITRNIITRISCDIN